MSEWIDLNERWPRDGDRVLVAPLFGLMLIAWCYRAQFWAHLGDFARGAPPIPAAYWMPLPAAPAERPEAGEGEP